MFVRHRSSVRLLCGLMCNAGGTVTLVTASNSARVVSLSLQLWTSWAPGFAKVRIPPLVYVLHRFCFLLMKLDKGKVRQAVE